MRVAHMVVITPGRCGLYETTRELVAGLFRAGVDSRMVDPTKETNKLHPGGDNDRCAPIADMEWALKADIIADPVLNAIPNTDDGAFQIAAVYNALAVPDYIVWRTSVPTADCKKAAVWTEFIGRNAGERDAWIFMLSNGFINAAEANVRQGIQDIFSGVSGATSRANLLAIVKRKATRGEKVLATGLGTDASPSTMSFEGTLSYQDILTARNLP